LELGSRTENDRGSFVQTAELLRNKASGAELRVVLLAPKNWTGLSLLLLSDDGKSSLFSADGSPAVNVKRLLDAGVAVFGVDLFMQGEFLPQGEPAQKNRPVKNPREFAGYTYGYNYSLLAQRAHDILTMIGFMAFTKHFDRSPKSIALIALDGTAPIAAAALARYAGAVDRAALDTRGFRFGKLTDYLDANFLPGGAKYGDLPGMLSLATPPKLWLAGETAESAALTKQANKASYPPSTASRAITFDASKPDETKQAAIEWIIKVQ